MPTVLTTNRLHESSPDQVELPLFNESGELTVAGGVIADFLEHADFSDIFEHPAARPYVITLVDEADETVMEEVLPGAVVLRLVDESDLTEMFLNYLDMLGENAQRTDAKLDDKTKLAVFENALLAPLEEKFKRGAFRNIRKQKGGEQLVNRMIGAIMRKGQIKRAKPGSGYKGGDYERTGRYKEGERKSVKQKRMRIRKTKAGKIKAARAQSRGARKRLSNLAASLGMEESFLFGFGEPYGGALFQVSPRADVTEVAFTKDEFAEVSQGVGSCYEGMKPKTTAECAAYGDEDGDEKDESVTMHTPVLGEAQMSYAVGSPTLAEGASIAAAAIGRTQTRKPLDESKKS